MEIKEKFLPIGTVVLLKNGNKKVMITSYLIFPTGEAKKQEMYDYGGCTFPEGVIDSKIGIGFNHDQIQEVCHMGFENDESKEFSDTIKKYAEDFKKIYKDSIATKKDDNK